MKKIVILLMLCILMISPVFAETTAGEELFELGLIDGTENGLDEDKTLNRASLAALLTDFYGVSEVAKNYPKNIAASLYVDVDETYWGAPYIGYVYAQSWMIGGGNQNFMPEDNVSEEMICTVFLKVLGYSPVWGSATSDAKKLGIETEVIDSSNLLRKEVFEIAVDALNTEVHGSDKLLGDVLNLDGYNVKEPLSVNSFKALKRNVLEIEFNQVVDAYNISFRISKNNNTVFTSEPIWNSEKTSVKFYTNNDMVNGTYVVAVNYISEESEITSATVVEDSYASELVIKDTTALSNGKEAFVYYDVYDQYGDSQSGKYAVTWISDQTLLVDKEKGLVRITKKDGSYFMLGEEVMLTGVYTYRGLTITQKITIGQMQIDDHVEIKGFLKKGTSAILTHLPVGFDTGTYYVLFNILDQNGNQVLHDKPLTNYKVALISNNSAAIKDISGINETVVTIDFEDYYAAVVTPGTSPTSATEYTIVGFANGSGKSDNYDTYID